MSLHRTEKMMKRGKAEALLVKAFSFGREWDESIFRELLKETVFLRWDEPVTMSIHGMEVHVYPFATVVVFGLREELERDILSLFSKFTDEREVYEESYLWIPEGKMNIDEEYVYGSLDGREKRILSFVMAQSASLKRIESKTDMLLDRVESLIEDLSSFNPVFGIRGIRKALLEALRTRNELLNDLLILEAPSFVGEKTRYERFFEKLRYMMDIDERYRRVGKKLDYVMEVTRIGSEMVNDTRMLLLEFLIVLFFSIEVAALFLGMW